MRIIVFGYYYSTNLGDAVICECTADILRRSFPNVEILIRDVCGNTEFPQTNFGMNEENQAEALLGKYQRHYRKMRIAENISRYTPLDLEYVREARRMAGRMEKLKKIVAAPCDAVVFAGGQMFMDSLMVCMIYLIHTFARRRIPVFINACGTGPAVSRKIRAQMAKTLMLPEVKWISCRDHADLVKRRYLKNGKTAEDVSDPALWSEKVYRNFLHSSQAQQISSALSDLDVKEKRPVGLGIMLPYNMDPGKLKAFWKEMILYLDQNKIPWVVALNGGDMDYAFAVKVLSDIPGDSGFPGKSERIRRILPVPKKPEELVCQIAGLRGMISFRLHSHIIGASLGVPSVAIVWDDKVRSFFTKIGHPERCFELSARPEVIWSAFKKAEKDGIDSELVKSQREDSAHKLVAKMREFLHE